MEYKSKAVVLFSVLVLASLSTVPSVRAAASEVGGDTDSHVDLQFESGRVSGLVVRQPLGEILDRFKQERGVIFHASSEVRSHRVSGKFNDKPEDYVLKRLLHHFNYVISYNSAGRITRVRIAGLAARHANTQRPYQQPDARALRPKADAARLNSPKADATRSNAPIPVIEAAPGVELSDEERRAFESGMREGPGAAFYNQAFQDIDGDIAPPPGDPDDSGDPGDAFEMPDEFSGPEGATDQVEYDTLPPDAEDMDEDLVSPEFYQDVFELPSDQDPAERE